MQHKFDWYQATLPERTVLSEVYRWLDEICPASKPGKPMNGYESCIDYEVCKVLSGGYSGKWGPHIIVHGGDITERIVWHVRKLHPDHRVTRVDVALDFQAPDIFDAIVCAAVEIKEEFGLNSNLIGDWLDAKKGRTFYLGSPKSTHFVRIYEKGYEQRRQGRNQNAPLDWVRVEFVVKPSGPVKGKAATLTPEQIICSTPWTTALYNLLGFHSEESVKLSCARRKPEAVLSLEHMFKQYAKTIKQAVDDDFLTPDDLHAALDQCIQSGKFDAFPPHVFRSWYFGKDYACAAAHPPQ